MSATFAADDNRPEEAVAELHPLASGPCLTRTNRHVVRIRRHKTEMISACSTLPVRSPEKERVTLTQADIERQLDAGAFLMSREEARRRRIPQSVWTNRIPYLWTSHGRNANQPDATAEKEPLSAQPRGAGGVCQRHCPEPCSPLASKAAGKPHVARHVQRVKRPFAPRPAGNTAAPTCCA